MKLNFLRQNARTIIALSVMYNVHVCRDVNALCRLHICANDRLLKYARKVRCRYGFQLYLYCTTQVYKIDPLAKVRVEAIGEL